MDIKSTEQSTCTIAIAGTGYVGLSNAVLLSQHNKVYAVDIIPEKVDAINSKKSPIIDKEIEEYLSTKSLNLFATTDSFMAYKEADIVIISTPTNYDPLKNYFNTSSVEDVIDKVISVNDKAIIVIKSTVPVGYTESVCKKNIERTALFSVLNFCGRGMHYTTTYIPRELSSEFLIMTKKLWKKRISLSVF